MRKSLCALTTSFLFLTACLPVLAVERRYLEKGAPAPFTGYLFDLEYGQAVASGWAKAEADANTWKTAYEDLRREISESTKQQQHNTDTLKQQLDAERRNWRRKVNRRTITCIILGGVIGAVLHNNH